MPPQVKFVLFDLDGLLIDTESIYTIVTSKLIYFILNSPL